MSEVTEKHWSKVELLADTVQNPNIHIRGKHSYYSNAWTGSFEQSVVRYLYGDEFSLAKPMLAKVIRILLTVLGWECVA